MKAVFVGMDYMLFLEKDKDELAKLKREQLAADLKEGWGGGSLGKTVAIKLEENDGPDGFELNYEPPDAGGWDEVKGVNVKINRRAYNHIVERGVFGTRYNGSDKITVQNDMPDF